MKRATKAKRSVPDQVIAIQEAWNSLYQLGDDALKRSRDALEKTDMEAFHEAQRSFEKVREALVKLGPVSDTALVGRKFQKGRKKGSAGPIRKRIEKELAIDQTLKPRQLWEKIKAKPPNGWEFFDNSLGRYAEGPHQQNMSYARFCNVCSEERSALKS